MDEKEIKRIAEQVYFECRLREIEGDADRKEALKDYEPEPTPPGTSFSKIVKKYAKTIDEYKEENIQTLREDLTRPLDSSKTLQVP